MYVCIQSYHNPLEDIAMIAKSAYHVRNWLDNNIPDSDADSSYQ